MGNKYLERQIIENLMKNFTADEAIEIIKHYVFITTKGHGLQKEFKDLGVNHPDFKAWLASKIHITKLVDGTRELVKDTPEGRRYIKMLNNPELSRSARVEKEIFRLQNIVLMSKPFEKGIDLKKLLNMLGAMSASDMEGCK